MATAVGIIVVLSLFTIAMKELAFETGAGSSTNLGKFLNATILVFTALFVFLFILCIIEILHYK